MLQIQLHPTVTTQTECTVSKQAIHATCAHGAWMSTGATRLRRSTRVCTEHAKPQENPASAPVYVSADTWPPPCACCRSSCPSAGHRPGLLRAHAGHVIGTMGDRERSAFSLEVYVHHISEVGGVSGPPARRQVAVRFLDYPILFVPADPDRPPKDGSEVIHFESGKSCVLLEDRADLTQLLREVSFRLHRWQQPDAITPDA